MKDSKKIEFYAKVDDKGRITIPSISRKALGIKKGDIVKVVIFVDMGDDTE